MSLDDLLPRSGRALDVGGGSGRHAIWLARRGLDVTLADISEVGMALAAADAAAAGVSLDTIAIDIEEQGLPAGPWDLIIEFHFLHRPLFEAFPALLSPGGLLVFCQPTRSNLERHRSPGTDYVLEDGELPGLVQDLELLRYDEGWSEAGRHEARLVARRPA